MKKLFFLILFIFNYLFLPDLAFAADPLKTPNGWLPGLSSKVGLPGGGLPTVTDNIVPFVISILLFLIIVASLIMLIWGGVAWILSKGEKEGLTKAKATVTYAIIGLILGLSSFIILNTLGYIFGITF